jgi:tRNA dimethylallyltransferase
MLKSSTKFITILGPTATGKSSLAMELARTFGGEIICADSRTLFKGMDIGTAKPSAKDQALVPHHLIDVIDPGQYLGAAAFKNLALSTIEDISTRGAVPILVGGSGLYLDAVLYDYEFPTQVSSSQRHDLELQSDSELRSRLEFEDPAAFQNVDIKNRRRVIRALETIGLPKRRSSEVIPQALVLGTMMNKEVVQDRVQKRIKEMLDKGFIEEVRNIGEQYGWDSPALEVIGYRAFKGHVMGTKSLEEATADFVKGDMRLYKKQVTWFKRNSSIHWVDSFDQAHTLVENFIRLPS